jgi:hypothetical protein
VFPENQTAVAAPSTQTGANPLPTPDVATLPFLHENAVVVLPVGLKIYSSQTPDDSGVSLVLYQETGIRVVRVEINGWAVVTLARGPVDSGYVRMADLHQDGPQKGQLVTPPPPWLGAKITNNSGSDVNVRGDPSTTNDPIELMGANITGIQIGQQEQPDGTWFQLRFDDGSTGWVRSDAVIAR